MAGKSKSIFFDKSLLQSKAFYSLNTKTAYLVLVEFWMKRQMLKNGRQGKEQWRITNNGEIEFTYLEACGKFGITTGTFTNAINELREKGFIDIAASGQGVHKVKNLYSISRRWQKYGTEEYAPQSLDQKGQ